MPASSESRLIFVDSSAWVGLFAKDDQHHERALAAFDAAGEADEVLLTSQFVVAETVTLLRVRHGVAAAVRAWDELESESACMVVPTEPRLVLLAKHVLKKYDQLVLSFADCFSFAVMKELGIQDVLTFDMDFGKAGFTMRPQPR